jgi:cyclic pyranopterin phosphate synthase
MACRKDIPKYVVKDRILKIKILDLCGMTCTFCHNEGTPVSVDNIHNYSTN